jgi:hypothetical protein
MIHWLYSSVFLSDMKMLRTFANQSHGFSLANLLLRQGVSFCSELEPFLVACWLSCATVHESWSMPSYARVDFTAGFLPTTTSHEQSIEVIQCTHLERRKTWYSTNRYRTNCASDRLIESFRTGKYCSSVLCSYLMFFAPRFISVLAWHVAVFAVSFVSSALYNPQES